MSEPEARAAEPSAAQPHPGEAHTGDLSSRLNWLRAGVLGANDGIVSTASIVVGVAGASTSVPAIATAGIAALVGGAVSMALGEYVSVSSQSDSQRALIEKERRELAEDPDAELEELTRLWQDRGLQRDTAERVAAELTDRDALHAHLTTELGIDEDEVVSPWHAAGASAVAFSVGALLPLLAILLPPDAVRVPVTFVVVLLALALTGAIGAKIGGGSVPRATIRVVVGGALALAATFLIGSLLGTSGVV
ncbi:VIT family protein [Curtobacterium citreum]|uniref:VIT1/CCC1 transporter family protein n=1 Tax=Curtobacterium citreum TaxID=2036 RepID=UPI00255104BE|nr:VIT family protein [Curtobacterium citreum]MDK8172526.1 VIT family protein [Curtobacterium citreum]